MTGGAAGLEGAGNHRRALSRVGTGVGTAERGWRETREKQGLGQGGLVRCCSLSWVLWMGEEENPVAILSQWDDTTLCPVPASLGIERLTDVS